VIRGRSTSSSFNISTPPAGVTFKIDALGGGVYALATADWTGDGKSDLLIGVPNTDEERGSVYVVPGQATLVNMRLDVLGSWHRIDGDFMQVSAGEALAAGDFNGDRRADIAVGAPWTILEDPEPFTFGRVGVFLGRRRTSDGVAPVAQPPAPRLFSSTALTANPTVRITWPAATDNVGVAKYRLQKKVNTGTWKDVQLTSPATLSADVGLAAGTNRYTFRVRAIDHAGNVSTWKTGPSFKVHRIQEDSSLIDFSTPFTREALNGASGGFVTWSGTEGHTATFNFSGRAVGFVSTFGVRGRLEISVDGGRLSVVDMFQYANVPAWIPVAYNLEPGPHTVVVEALGTSNGASGNPRIDIDAFIVIE
jgi:hypothetical protein